LHAPKRVGLDESSLVRLLALLEKKGFIERPTDNKDRRLRIVVLTSLGRTTVRSLRAELQSVESSILEDISEAELSAALRVFDVIEFRLDHD
jgi:MarR family transcriptional regulator for hemolysin